MSVSDHSTTIDMLLFPFGVALSSPRISYCSQLKEIVYHINLIDCIPFIDFLSSFLFCSVGCCLSSIHDDVTCLYTPFLFKKYLTIRLLRKIKRNARISISINAICFLLCNVIVQVCNFLFLKCLCLLCSNQSPPLTHETRLLCYANAFTVCIVKHLM